MWTNEAGTEGPLALTSMSFKSRDYPLPRLPTKVGEGCQRGGGRYVVNKEIQKHSTLKRQAVADG